MPNTTIHALPYPTQVAAGPGPDVPSDIKVLADALDPKLTPFSTGAGNPADIPLAPGKVGRRFRNTTNGSIWLDIGAAWVQESISLAGSDTIDIGGNIIAVKRYGANDSALGVVAGQGLYVITDETSLERPAGGALRIKDGGVTGAKVAAALKPSAGAAAATEALRALGTGAGTAAAGNDGRLSEGAAGIATVRSLGGGGTQAAAGNDSRIVNAVQQGDARLVANPVNGVENLRLIRGYVNADGTIAAGSGFTIEKHPGNSGWYTIHFNPAFPSLPTTVVVPHHNSVNTPIMVHLTTAPTVSSQTIQMRENTTDTLRDAPFQFITTGPR